MGSPRLGSLEGRFDPLQQARDYARGGAAALSVVVEPDFFFGSYGRLAECAAACGLPAIAKDFVVDPLQLRWAQDVRRLGHPADRRALHRGRAARSGRKLAARPRPGAAGRAERPRTTSQKLEGARWELVGINNRNLRTFVVELENSLGLLPRLPPDALKVAESGIHTQ